MALRRATHAGCWYPDSPMELSRQLDTWLNAAEPIHGPARAIIVPHAGYQYCGACSALAYRQVIPGAVRRVFILGPSHHARLDTCCLPAAYMYGSPLYDVKIDTKAQIELEATGQFEWLTIPMDENEHSIEMQLPFITNILKKDSFTIMPILVGSLTPEKEALYGQIFARYLSDPHTLFVVSSDFCHWGGRFRYSTYEKKFGQIHQYIEMLDRKAMDIIEDLDPAGFVDYFNEKRNTICGRHAIAILLQAADILKKSGTNAPKLALKFLSYVQSNKCTKKDDSSVSYAAASLVCE